MIYQVLARKWRPKDFTSLVGQEHVVRALAHALDGGRLHHAYLFTGTRGVGKTTLARIFAKALNCERGVTSQPCGVCRVCCEIDEGRFVDYVEMDAASNRGVDEMAALLERAIYAPVDARFKVYMIDEVHMLTNHAFNAMLKTLEEPPSHVKFILATTDPQKIPVTVLSRCLQFNLKQMPAGHIVAYLERILGEERIPFEMQALRLLARAAQGSMRDALSLTDQAIAYSANEVTESAVSNMLGALDQTYMVRLLDALALARGGEILAIADEMTLRSLSFATALRDLASLLHRVAWAQFAPETVLDEWPEAADLQRFAALLSPEQVQLYYQIATLGRSELSLAPDEYAGFTMTLLRMLAFEFVGAAGGSIQAVLPKKKRAVPEDKSATDGAALYAPSVRQPLAEPKASAPCAFSSGAEQSAPVWATEVAVVEAKIPPPREGPAAALDVLRRHVGMKAAPASRARVAGSMFPASSADDGWADSAPDKRANADMLPPPWLDMPLGEPILAVRDHVPGDVVPADERRAAIPLAPGSDVMEAGLNNVPSVAADEPPVPAVIALEAIGYDGEWPTLAASLPLKGIAHQLAFNSELVALDGVLLKLCVPVVQYAEAAQLAKLKSALVKVLGKPVEVVAEVGVPRRTAAAVATIAQAQRQREAESEIDADSFVQQLIHEFGASVIEGSVRLLAASEVDLDASLDLKNGTPTLH